MTTAPDHLVTFSDAVRIIGRKYGTSKLLEKMTGLTCKAKGKKFVFYSEQECRKAAAALDEKKRTLKERKVAAMNHARTFNNKIKGGASQTVLEAVAALRAEQSAAFNILMDEMGAIKTLLTARAAAEAG